MISLQSLALKLKDEKRVALFCHVRPDGDSIGSALALKLALLKLGVDAEVVCDDPVPSRFFFLKEVETVKSNLNGEYSALIAMDCADVTRLGSFSDVFLKHKNTYSIDHHVSNNRYSKTNYVVERSSNCENVLSLITEMGVEIDQKIANLIALGIITDTGNFKHKNVSAETLKSASIAKEKGADLNLITYKTFNEQTKERAKLFGRVMSCIRYFENDRFALATIRLSDLEASGAKPEETEGFIDFVMGIDTVEIGACIMETSTNVFKVSFRSKGADVNAVAGTFGGGGHTLASGCRISGEYEEVVDKIRFAVSRELPI